MNAKQIILAGCAIIALGMGTAQAGPCDAAGKSASSQDAGSGPTPGNTGQTTGTATGTSTNQLRRAQESPRLVLESALQNPSREVIQCYHAELCC
jgi:hypothetical protein